MIYRSLKFFVKLSDATTSMVMTLSAHANADLNACLFGSIVLW